MILVILASIGGFAVGGFMGFGIFFVARAGLDYWHSKKECRECRKRMAESGFHVGYNRYKCVEVK